MAVFFTADTHFGHKNILHFGKGSPFNSIEEMEEAFIQNWNEKVSEEDTVYVLGDFCWGFNVKRTKCLVNALNGKKILVYGNHDRLDAHYKSGAWQDIVPYCEVWLDGKCIILSHYPFAEWKYAYNGSIHLHGHTHNTFDFSTLPLPHKNKQILDVGVDSVGFAPISWEEVKTRLNID